MKLVSVYSESHKILKDEWMLATLKDDYDLSMHNSGIRGNGRYLESDWTDAVQFKSQTIIQSIRGNWGKIFIYADVDLMFFAPTKDIILRSMEDNDIVCQVDDPKGNLCTGFFALRANAATLSLWEKVYSAVMAENRDQVAFNRIIRRMRGIRYGYLPPQFFGYGTFNSGIWTEGKTIYLPARPVMFHANWTIGVDNKIALLTRVRNIVQDGRQSVSANNLKFYIQNGWRGYRRVTAIKRRQYSHSHEREWIEAAPKPTRPRSIRLDASTVCQLKCPSCPTAGGMVAESVGAGFLTATNFERLINKNSYLSNIELSNWGEIFLNPHLSDIVRYAYRKNVALRADNGVNLNSASDEVLDAIVKYKVRALTCSIDGASQDVYRIYRVNGNFDRVIENIKKINSYKEKYRSPYPYLKWQFVIFGHNEDEIENAKALAKSLNMNFYLKLSWDDLYTVPFSPVRRKEMIREISDLHVADRLEFEERYKQNYIIGTCHHLWNSPQINFDGKVLGCSVNYWGDFGNAFTERLEDCLNSEKMNYARGMLLGLKESREDIPCSTCKIYKGMKNRNQWISQSDIASPHVEGRYLNLIRNRMHNPLLRVSFDDTVSLIRKAHRYMMKI